MRRLQPLLIALAGLAAVVALGIALFSGEAPPEPVFEVADVETGPRVTDRGADKPIEGGVYGGRVETLDGRPIHGARVLLVAYDGGRPSVLSQGTGADPDPDVIGDVPIVGRYKVGGEGITDKDGGFRIAADAQSMITRVLAYHEGYFLSVTEVERPREDILLRLGEGGRVIGRVVDDETGEPVPGALVDLYLQQKVSPIPEGVGTYGVVKRDKQAVSWLATLGRFIGETLGPRIWNVVDSKGETLKLRTDKHGRFEIGPLGNSVQLEFVISHNKYKWSDFDTNDGEKTPNRLVVEPGQTIEREFRLKKGKHIAGQVVDDEGKGVPDVFVKVQSISAYYRHWWYRHKWRRARTDKNGRFRVDGLALGSQQVIFQHPSFKEITESVEAGTDDFLVVVERFGALRGTIEGVPRSRHQRRITVFFEAVDPAVGAAEQFKRATALQTDNTFLVERITPGAYRAWVKAGKESSQPIDLTIEALGIAKESFEIGAGGTLLARIVDDRGGIVDPASGRLVSHRDGRQRAMGTFVTREGEFEVEGLAPGTYHFEVSAPGRIPKKSETFEIGADRVMNLGSLTLSQYGFVRFQIPVDRRGRPVKLTQDLVIEYRQGDGAWQRVFNAGTDVALQPGPLSYRARSGSLRYEGTLEVVPGETLDASIVFDPE